VRKQSKCSSRGVLGCDVTTWCHNPEHLDLNLHRCDNLKCRKIRVAGRI